MSVSDKTLDSVLWQGSTPGVLGKVEYLLSAITLRSTQTQNSGTC